MHYAIVTDRILGIGMRYYYQVPGCSSRFITYTIGCGTGKIILKFLPFLPSERGVGKFNVLFCAVRAERILSRGGSEIFLI